MSGGKSAICGKCGRPFRKGQSAMMTTFARYSGITEHGAAFDPWLSVVVHLKCDLKLTAELLREARLARRLPRTVLEDR